LTLDVAALSARRRNAASSLANADRLGIIIVWSRVARYAPRFPPTSGAS
jgi:hypothetical protein